MILNRRGEHALTFDDFDRTKLVSANRRIHHYTRSALADYWRQLARRVALEAYGQADEGEAWHTRVRIELWFRFPDRRRHDVGNLYPYVAKPLVDGLVDARLIPDDDDGHLVGPDMRRDPDKGPHRIVVVVEDLDQ